MRIRQMTAEDIPAVAQIEKECFSQPWSEQGFLDGMKDAIFFRGGRSSDRRLYWHVPDAAGGRLPMWQ